MALAGAAGLIAEDQLPALRRAAAAGVFDTAADDPDADFAFGLDRILDGIGQLVTQRALPARDG